MGASGSRLGRRLAAIRKARGLSPNGLSALTGVSRGALRLLEQGGDARRSTLARLLAALPELDVNDVLPAAVGRTPPSGSGPWTLLRDAHGAVASRQRLVVMRGGESLEVRDEISGVRALRGASLGARDLLRLAWLGAPALVPNIEAARGRIRVEEGGIVHEVRKRAGAACTLDVTRARRITSWTPVEGVTGAIEAGAVAVVGMPIETLELVAAGLPEARLMAWPVPLVPDDGSHGALSALHVHGEGISTHRSPGRIAFRVRRPQVGMAYALVLDSRSPAVARRSTATTPLAAARAACGLTLRELAARCHVPLMSVADAESGRDVRLSTLGRIAEALDDASAWALLDAGADAERTATPRAWGWQRDAWGCEIGEETKDLSMDADGNAAIVIRTQGLRRVRAVESPWRVRIGHVLPVVQATRARLQHVAQPVRGQPALRIGRAPASDGSPAHVLVVPRALAQAGVRYSRRLQHASVYSMTAERARARVGAEGPYVEGTTFAPFLPTRVLRIVVRFPKGFEPADLRAGAWPLRALPEPESGDRLERLHPRAWKMTMRSGSATLAIERPLLGLKYGISWTLG